MKAKRILAAIILALSAVTVSSNVSAEQPAAEEYRQMFRSGTFYVEYQISRKSGGHTFKSGNMVLAGQDGKRMYRITNAGSTKGSSGAEFDVESLSGIYNNSSLNRRIISYEEFKVKKWPDVLYQDGKYYRFITSGPKAEVRESAFSSLFGKSKQVVASVLPEDQLNSPVLDPNEEWNYVREDLALPDELAVFAWKDPFRDNFFDLPAPAYENSSKKTVDDKEYDCDRYITEIKNLAGDVAAQEIYDMLYENGKLVLIQKYLKHGDKENFVREFKIKEITAAVPEKTFEIAKKIKVYAAANGDMNDMLEKPVEAGTIGGK